MRTTCWTSSFKRVGKHSYVPEWRSDLKRGARLVTGVFLAFLVANLILWWMVAVGAFS